MRATVGKPINPAELGFFAKFSILTFKIPTKLGHTHFLIDYRLRVCKNLPQRTRRKHGGHGENARLWSIPVQQCHLKLLHTPLSHMYRISIDYTPAYKV